MIIIVILFWAIFFGLLGALLGQAKSAPGEGAILGMFLGPIGLICIAMREDPRPKCLHCGSPRNSEYALCPNCGREQQEKSPTTEPVEQPSILFASPPKPEPLYWFWTGQEATGPFPLDLIRKELASQRITPEHLVMLEGGAEWQKAGELLTASAPIVSPKNPE